MMARNYSLASQCQLNVDPILPRTLQIGESQPLMLFSNDSSHISNFQAFAFLVEQFRKRANTTVLNREFDSCPAMLTRLNGNVIMCNGYSRNTMSTTALNTFSLTKSEHSNDEICVVCSDKASGRHYGAISCEGCKGFFKRSIRKQIAYICRGDRDCHITKFHRNRCQFCRLRKCLAMGMKSESVQSERRPMNAALVAAATVIPHSAQSNSLIMKPNVRSTAADVSQLQSSASLLNFHRLPLTPQVASVSIKSCCVNSSSTRMENQLSQTWSNSRQTIKDVISAYSIDELQLNSNFIALMSPTDIESKSISTSRRKRPTIHEEDISCNTSASPSSSSPVMIKNAETLISEEEINFEACKMPNFQFDQPAFGLNWLLYKCIIWTKNICSCDISIPKLLKSHWQSILLLSICQYSNRSNFNEFFADLKQYLQNQVSSENIDNDLQLHASGVLAVLHAADQLKITSNEFAYLRLIVLTAPDDPLESIDYMDHRQTDESLASSTLSFSDYFTATSDRTARSESPLAKWRDQYRDELNAVACRKLFMLITAESNIIYSTPKLPHSCSALAAEKPVDYINNLSQTINRHSQLLQFVTSIRMLRRRSLAALFFPGHLAIDHIIQTFYDSADNLSVKTERE